MIPHAEVLALRGEWNLRADIIEKDYVLGWMLNSIATDSDLSETWVFKGGTCLRKCFFETYRLSEDLDFTIVDGGPETPRDLRSIFERIGEEQIVSKSKSTTGQKRVGGVLGSWSLTPSEGHWRASSCCTW